MNKHKRKMERAIYAIKTRREGAKKRLAKYAETGNYFAAAETSAYISGLTISLAVLEASLESDG